MEVRGRRSLSALGRDGVENTLIREVFAKGRFFRPTLAWDDVMIEILELIPKITATTGCRTLGLLHVASARGTGLQ